MLQWQHLFPVAILQRGRDYYKNNKVRSLIRDGEVYYAQVEGTQEYEVTVRVSGDRISAMSCSCLYAADGSPCRHMAAALFEICARDGSRSLSSGIRDMRMQKKRKIPEFEDLGEDYVYFQPSRFSENLRITDIVYQKARELLDQGKVTDFTIDFAQMTEVASEEKCLVARGKILHRSYAPVTVIISHDGIRKLSCTVYGCRNCGRSITNQEKMEICEHCLAVLILAAEEIRRHPRWDSTDENAQRLLKRFRTQLLNGGDHSEKSQDDGRKICLKPRLEETVNGLNLSFRIGTDEKLYVLKNPELLTEAVQTEGEYILGTRTELDFHIDSFGEEDRRWFELIRQAVLEKKFYDEPFRLRPQRKLQSIALYGSLLDGFFDLAEGSSLEMKSIDGERRVLEIGGDAPEICLTLRSDCDTDGFFHGMILEGKLPRVLEGVRYRYCLEAESLYRLEPERLNNLEDLFRSSTEGFLRMRIGRSFLTDFYRNIIPELKNCFTILEPDREEIDQYLPPEVSFQFWLDAQDGTPLCRATAKYGEASYSVSDWLRQGVSKSVDRDQLRESAVLLEIRNFFPELLETGELRSQPDEDSVFRVLTDGLNTLWKLGEVMSTVRFDALKLRRGVKIRLGVSLESGLLDLQISSEDVTMEELTELLQSYRLKKKYHRLRSGDFVCMDDSIAELAQLTETLNLSNREIRDGEISIPAYRAIYLEQMMEKSEAIYAKRDRYYRELIKSFRSVRDADFEVPEELEGVLRGYQIYGYKWLRTLSTCGFGGILADEMGLGKTLQLIAVLLSVKLEGDYGTSLIVCPASLVYNWVEEFRSFAPLLSVCPVEGSQQQRREILEHFSRWDVMITSYDHLKRDIDAYEGKLFSYEVLDEAQFIKNQTTSAAKAVKAVKAKHRFALTGTPIENRLSELWSIFDFLMTGFLYRYENFRSELERPVTRDGDAGATARLKKMVSPFILRRLKTEVLKDLPEKVEKQHVVRFGEEQQKLYDAQVLRMRNLLQKESDESFRKNKIRILAELMRLRQICCDPALLFENYQGGSAKLEACMDLLRSAIEGEHRILLFSQFTSMLELIRLRLQEEGIRWYEITGATPKQERLRLVTDFNTGEVPVFLISLRAGGTGLNLTGADIVIHYDPWWNAAAQNQATDRAHRIGQEKPVTVFKLLAKDSVEEKIAQLQEAKLDLAEEILGGEQLSFSALSREDLLALID